LAKVHKGGTELPQIATSVKYMVAAVKDLNELAVLQSLFIREKVDLVLKRCPDQPNLETLIAERRLRLSDSAKLKEGLNNWVNQAPLEEEKAPRQRVAAQILASLNDLHQSRLELDVRGLTNLPAEIGALSHVK